MRTLEGTGVPTGMSLSDRSDPPAKTCAACGRLIELLSTRRATATVCPSEVARSLEPQAWRSLMEPVRRAARRLAAEGHVEFRQKGRAVDPSSARGPVRLGRGRRWGVEESVS